MTEWDELKWVQRAPNLTYSYKTCEAAKRILLMTQIGHDPNGKISNVIFMSGWCRFLVLPSLRGDSAPEDLLLFETTEQSDIFDD